MICIIDYGMGNLHSVVNALEHIGAECMISSTIEDIRTCDKLILPGVGAFPEAMKHLQEAGLIEVIKEEVTKGKPFLGICLGMQIAFEKGYENEECEGLGLLQGEVILMEDPKVKIPHMGWNKLELATNTLDLKENTYMYFVHSYMASNYNEDYLVAYSTYGNLKIPAIFHKDNILLSQCHPEKSGEDGLNLLRKFKEEF